MRLSPLILLLLSSSILSAQTPSVLTAPPGSQSCPVDFSVKRTPNSGLIAVERPGLPAAPPSQGLQFHIAGVPGSTVVKADVTVHGMTPGARIIPTASGAQLPLQKEKATPDDATETFELALGPDSVLRPTVTVKKLAVINWVEITRLDYADGTTWQPTAGSRCTAAPSLLVLVHQ